MKKLYLLRLLVKDISYRKITCITVFFMIAFINCLYIVVNVCADSFSEGIHNVTNRLGADIVIVSSEYDAAFQDMLFLGYPSTIVFDADFYDELRSCACVKSLTKQLFLSSLNSDCCESEVQFIVYDEQTDTVVQSLIDTYTPENERRDILVGANIQYEIGDKAKFFECVFRVAGKLAHTGMGYDDCIFVNRQVGESVLNYLRIEQDDTKASMILIELWDKTALQEAYDEISAATKSNGVSVYKTNEIFNELSSKVNLFALTSRFFVIALEVIACVALFAIFTLSVEGKRSSIDALEVIGVPDFKKALLVIFEGLLISLLAALVGALCGLGLLFVFRHTVASAFGLQIILSQRTLWSAAVGIGISGSIAVISNLYSAYLTVKIGRKDR